jgi:YidC/Oxa1 family membrane protein insertase
VTAIMIVLMSLSQFYTQRQLMTKNVDTTVKTPFMQQQKMLMYVFPVMFAVFGINFPVGVLVYWLTTNVWTMGQQMYVIHNNPTPGSKAQAAYLERLTKHVMNHGKARKRSERTIIKAIVAKGRDRNEFERKFINGLNKAGLAAVIQSEAQATVQTEDGSPASAATPKRQQPKRQSKSQRQSGAASAGSKAAGDTQPSEPTSLTKSDEPEDAKPAAPAKKQSGGGTRSKAQSGQRKGPQRPKSPSKK